MQPSRPQSGIEQSFDTFKNSLDNLGSDIGKTNLKKNQSSTYEIADLGKDCGQTILQFGSYIALPLSLIAMIPVIAGTGALSASLLSATVLSAPVSPLAGVVILGSFACVAAYTMVALSAFEMSLPGSVLPEDGLAGDGPKRYAKIGGISTLNGLFLYHLTSNAAFVYLGMPTLAFSTGASVTVVAILIVKIGYRLGTVVMSKSFLPKT